MKSCFKPFVFLLAHWVFSFKALSVPKSECIIIAEDKIIKGCYVGGNLYHFDRFLTGKFVADLSKLETDIKKIYLNKKNRYAWLKLDIVSTRSKRFHAMFKLNRVKRFISGDIVSASSRHIELFFTIKPRHYGFPSYTDIGIKVRLYNGFD